MEQIRVWKEIDIKEIDGHLLICDDLSAHCGACRKMPIPLEASRCPECGTEFNYITTRENHTTPTGQRILSKMLQSGNKSIIEYSDYKHASDKKKAQNLFK
ncbi:MAG: hypothetical protein PF637_13195 [Spirochaetes bacterium]|nr:hypothetical protein [Spirochaetota bacterium]